MRLDAYKKKRKFNSTPEPKGKHRKQKGRLSFVVQKHNARRLHYDFRLEMDGVLKSWAVPKGPSLNPENKRLAMMVEDHPLEYGSFEGAIPEGNYGAGEVIIWDNGTYELKSRKSIDDGELIFELFGKKLKGEFVLVKTSSTRYGKNKNAWLLIKRKDKFAKDQNILAKDASIKSGKTIEDIAYKKPSKKIARVMLGDLRGAKKSPMPKDAKPMFATLISEPPEDDEWLSEIKWDGYRSLINIVKGDINLYSRTGLNFTNKYPLIKESFLDFSHEAIIDGEITVSDQEGKPKFQLIQGYPETHRGALVFYAFDLLWINGWDLRELPLYRRKEILRKILPESDYIKFSDHISGKGAKFLENVKKRGLEGIISKHKDSPYKSGIRSRNWVKIKGRMRQEAVIGGFTEGRGGRKHLGALLLGVYKEGELQYIGHTGGGFDDKSLVSVKNKLAPLEQELSPFKDEPEPNAPVHWVKPKLICEVEFQEWTADGIMRAPVFLGLREDKKPEETVKEVPVFFGKVAPSKKDDAIIKIGNAMIAVTNLSKTFFPEDGYTKKDLIDYYRSVSKYVLPYLKGRPESLNRHPDGINGENFFHKNISELKLESWAKTYKIYSRSEGRTIKYLLCENEPTLIFMANLGCIEINPWNSRIKELGSPDYCILDLDPLDIEFNAVIETANVLHEVLEKAEIKSYCKTSGKKGMHICIPLGAKYSYDECRQFAEIIANITHEKLPKITSVERNPNARAKKVYLDFLQNRKGQTLTAPYSVRPINGAPVSTPLDWREVKPGLKPINFTIKNTLERLKKKGDLWKPVLGKGMGMNKALKKLGN